METATACCAAAPRAVGSIFRGASNSCSCLSSPWPQGPENTIKAEQVLFQAQKKASGNTFTARGMPLNIFAAVYIVGGGAIMVFSAFNKMYWGRGKIVKTDE